MAGNETFGGEKPLPKATLEEIEALKQQAGRAAKADPNLIAKLERLGGQWVSPLENYQPTAPQQAPSSPPDYDAEIPLEKMAALISAFIELAKEADTPEKFAESLQRMSEEAPKYSQSLWFFAKGGGAKGPDRPDWVHIYQGIQRKIEKPEIRFYPTRPNLPHPLHLNPALRKPAEQAGIEISPEKLAQLLFTTLVLDEEQTFMDAHIERFREAQGFQGNAFERLQFFYLVANIAIALTNASKEMPGAIEVISAFRLLVLAEASNRWGDSEAAIDAEIEESCSDLATLSFTDPDQNRGLSFDWSKEWLKRIGIEESNPAVLFRISHLWKSQYLHTAKLLKRFRLMA